jgi:aryl-alcohol dehydrogenase-like predicted oxidoreductase
VGDADEFVCARAVALAKEPRDTYASGEAETILREALGDRRDEIVIGTKFGYDIYNHPERAGQQERPHDWSPGYMRAALERSLERLGTEYIDRYQLHNPRIEAIRDDALWKALDQARETGRIRTLGVALGPAIDPRQVDEAVVAIRERSAIPQIIFNLFEQQIGAPVFPIAREHSVPVLVRVPHASGLLDGSVQQDTTFEPGDHRNWRVTTNERRKAWLEDGLRQLQTLPFLSEGRTIGQAASSSSSMSLRSPRCCQTSTARPCSTNSPATIPRASLARPSTSAQALHAGNFGLVSATSGAGS